MRTNFAQSSPPARRVTLLLWARFLLVMAGFYFVTSWTPTLLVQAGLSSTQGLTGGTLLNLGGIFGAALLGVLAARFALRSVLSRTCNDRGAARAVDHLDLLPGRPVVTRRGDRRVRQRLRRGLDALTAVAYDTGSAPPESGRRSGSAGSARFSPTVAGALLDVGGPANLYITVGAAFVATALLLWVVRLAPAASRSPDAAHAG